MTIKFQIPLTMTFLASMLVVAPGCPSDDGEGEEEVGETAGDDQSDTETEGGVEVDEEAVLAEIAGYQDNFTLINAAPFESGAHAGGGIMVNVYVNSANAAQYKSINPDDPEGTATTFPEGTIVVKEHLDDMGNPNGGTAMYKAPAGYNSDNNDWWFGMGDLLGSNLEASGPDLMGCIGCHSPLTDTDYLVGIPADQQTP
ncbi:hypothetical protein PPSIR1_32317 [Plesiocystis pacifica SIR-1]|uniref:Cytochrome P460 domain-containing protein n=2 Tax=Plesiocystis pacifica TaxID=191768 RepID=A6G5J9_9BACT|nr:hypothetical protein PPSIR1_32317 [Plesiocystis pacifica SIR-1]